MEWQNVSLTGQRVVLATIIKKLVGIARNIPVLPVFGKEPSDLGHGATIRHFTKKEGLRITAKSLNFPGGGGQN